MTEEVKIRKGRLAYVNPAIETEEQLDSIEQSMKWFTPDADAYKNKAFDLAAESSVLARAAIALKSAKHFKPEDIDLLNSLADSKDKERRKLDHAFMRKNAICDILFFFTKLWLNTSLYLQRGSIIFESLDTSDKYFILEAVESSLAHAGVEAGAFIGNMRKVYQILEGEIND